MQETRFSQRYSDWLTGKAAETTSIPHLIDSYCRLMIEEGFDIFRCNLATDTIHPQMTGIRHVWYREAADIGDINPKVLVDRRQYRIGDAMIDEVFFNSVSHQNPQYKASPFYVVENKGELYERIRPSGETQAFPVFEDLAACGCTAYFGTKLRSFAGMLQIFSIATIRPNGFSKEQIDDLRWSIEILTLHLNTLIESSIKNTLAEVYLGRDPGRRVSQGMISAGNVVALEGAIWFSDIRGFTVASERLDEVALVEMLNAYFAAVVRPIYENGGEILKYIGDAILAIFPSGSFPDSQDACRAALNAVTDAENRLDELNRSRGEIGQAPICHGIGLHFGNARYGNIGTAQRLDFTLIGREVNIASRVEGLTKRLEASPLCSQPFVERSGIAMESLGQFELRGVSEKMKIFRPNNL
jgi:adenylate cyclase